MDHNSNNNLSGEDTNNSDTDTSSQQAAEVVGFAVEPKNNCQHFNNEQLTKLQTFIEKTGREILDSDCVKCKSTKENWICVTCNNVYCSRFIEGHMSEHVTEDNSKDHHIVFSFTDGSFWCYACDSYITNTPLKAFQQYFSNVKFPSNNNNNNKEQEKDNNGFADKMNDLIQMMKGLMNRSNVSDSEEIKPFQYQDLIAGLQNTSDSDNEGQQKKFKKIVFLTGAGISVSAGIPDFRTPGSGLYSQLEKYNLPFPEAIFEINYFKEKPHAFYKLSKEFLTCGSHPTVCHYFIAEINRKNQLLINFSQNIDGLEIEAGLPEDKLVQAHGHFRTAKCTSCQEVADIQKFYACAKEDKIHYCSACESGIVKPDIVFFGEQLPTRFFQKLSVLDQADLVFVIGTSLKVYPFASLVQKVDSSVPIVLVNRENPGINRKNFLFLEGDIDDSIEKILTDLKWEYPEIKRNYPVVPGKEEKSNL